MLSRKQKEGGSLESFYEELSGMVARCNLGTKERKMVRDIFIFNMRNRDVILYRSKRNRAVIFVDPGDEECKGDGDNTRIEEEPEHKSVDAIIVTSRISLQNNDNDAQQEPFHAISAKKWGISRRHVGKAAVLCGQPVGLIQVDEPLDEEDTPVEDVGSQHAANSVGFVKREHHSWSSESSDEYMVMAIRRKKETLLKNAGPKLKIYIIGHPMHIWIDSELPISILTLDDLKKTVGRTGINLKQDDMEDDEFWDYSNNRIKMLERMEVELASNGWKTRAEVRVIEGMTLNRGTWPEGETRTTVDASRSKGSSDEYPRDGGQHIWEVASWKIGGRANGPLATIF